MIAKSVLLLVSFIFGMEAMGFKNDPTYLEAKRKGALTRFTLRARTDEGMPVAGANVRVLMGMTFREKAYFIHGVTDTNGLFSVEGKTAGNEIEIELKKDGYYRALRKLCYVEMGKEHEASDGKWLPWGAFVEMPMRERRSPVDLIGVRDDVEIPDVGTWLGYDMEKRDWVVPGKTGLVKDFEVFLNWDGKQTMQSERLHMDVRFHGENGYYLADVVPGSGFGGVYQAETNHALLTNFSCRVSRVAGGWDDVGIPAGKLMVVRSRSRVDAKGELRSANYSVIRSLNIEGGAHGKASMFIRYHYNPEVNDRRLEPRR